jgi:cysteine synthase A
MKIASNILELVGRTPLLELARFSKNRGCGAKVIGKVEYFNPAGSIKDRVALNMVLQAENEGILKSGATIIEPTSGNTGVGLAMVCAVKGYNLILTMPETMSVERQKLLKAYGARIELTSGAEGMQGAINKANELRNSIEGAVILGQFDNTANPEAHYKTTAREIIEDTDGKIDVFVSAVGTGGTISGTAKALKEFNPNIYVVAVEPAESPVLSGGEKGPHKIQGIGAGFVPTIYNSTVVDEVVTVSGDDAMQTARSLAHEEGILVGISSGAAACVAARLAQRAEFAGKNIVCILPDTGERYLSVANLFD